MSVVKYKGCYADLVDGKRDLVNYLGNITTIDQCVILCRTNVFKYAGVQLGWDTRNVYFIINRKNYKFQKKFDTFFKFYLLYSNQCYCGNTYGNLGLATENSRNCDMNCVGNDQQTCGGYYANSVCFINFWFLI